MKTSDQYILAIDLGTSGCKVGLVSSRGAIVAWAFRPVELLVVRRHRRGTAPEDWWNAFLEASRDVLSQRAVPAGQVAGICASTQGEGTIAVDRNGRPLTNGITWLDMRGAQHLKKSMRGALKVAGYNAVKLQKWLRLCGGAPALSGKDPPATCSSSATSCPASMRRPTSS